MSDEDIISAMRRKAGAQRDLPDVTSMSIPKALGLAVAKSAEADLGMVMHVEEVVETSTSITRLPEEIPEHALMGLLEGPQDAYGLAIFSLTVTASVVEQLTTGKVLKIEPEVRKPSSTDAVMCFELMDRILQHFEMCMTEIQDGPDISGYKSSAQLQETRSIPIAFEDIVYRMFRVQVDIGQGARSGEILLVFPHQPPAPKQEIGAVSQWEQQFQASVLTTRASLDVILHKTSLPLSQVAGLEVGMDIPIPLEALQKMSILADGKRIASARLGQLRGHRALRVNSADEDENEDSLAREQLENPTGGLLDIGAPQGLELPSNAAFDGADMTNLGSSDTPSEMELPDLPPLGDLPSLSDIAGDLPAMSDIGDLPPLE